MTIAKPPKLPALKPLPTSIQKLANHIMLHKSYPKALPKLSKFINNSLPAVMR